MLIALNLIFATAVVVGMVSLIGYAIHRERLDRHRRRFPGGSPHPHSA